MVDNYDEEQMPEDKDPFQANEISIDQIRNNNDVDDEDNRFNSNTDIKQKIRKFLLYHKNQKYYKLLETAKADEKTSLTVDYDDVVNFDNILYKHLINFPKDFLSVMKTVLHEIDKEMDWDYFKDDKYFAIKLTGYPNHKLIKVVDVSLNNQLITLRGHVSKTSEKEPYIHKFYHKCDDCDRELFSDHDKVECPWCENNPVMKNYKNRNIYTNCMNIRIQELNEDLTGRVPIQLECLILGDNCDLINPGTKIHLTGFVELYEKFNTLSKRKPYYLLIRANNIEPFKTNVLADGDIALTGEDVQKINERLKDKKKLFETLVASYAPHVIGHEYVKAAILLAIVGSAKIHIDGMDLRKIINICLVGDPGTSKTDLLKFGEKVVLGSVYVSGRGVTGGGVTAVLLKDRDGRFSIQPGALIFANKSVLWFDESGQTSNEVKSHLHEAMESGTISLAKGGHVVSLQAETSIVMSGNPKWSRYVPDKSVTENIDMPEPIVNRFDLIFIILDLIDKDHDTQVSRHIDRIVVDKKIPNYGADVLSTIELIKYLNYVKEKDITPDFPQEVLDMNEEFYVGMRQKSTTDSISITPRQKYGLMRLQMAMARILVSPKVEKWMADYILKLMQSMIDAVMTDEDGNVNVQNISGKTVEKLQGSRLMKSIMLRLENDYEKDKIPKDEIRKVLREENNMTDKNIERFLEEMNKLGIISHTSERHVRLSDSSH
jgi:replicative DNA helicase Mcm